MVVNERTVLVDIVSGGAYSVKIESSRKLHQYSPMWTGVRTIAATEAGAAERRKTFIDHAPVWTAAPASALRTSSSRLDAAPRSSKSL